MRAFVCSALLTAVCICLALTAKPARAAEPDPKDIADDVAAARKELNFKSTSAGFFKANAEKRVEAWKAAAEKGSPGAQWLYGRCLELGIGAKEDLEAALMWFTKSAKQGFALGQNSL